MTCDPRYRALYDGLNQLTVIELRKILEYDGPMVWDGWNYDPERQAYCPLAVALGIPGMASGGMTNARCEALIGEIGGRRGPFRYNQMRGVPGDFYRESRAEDARGVVRELIAIKSEYAHA